MKGGKKCYASGGPITAANRDGGKSKVMGAPYAKGGSKKVESAAKDSSKASMGAGPDAAISGSWGGMNLGKSARKK